MSELLPWHQTPWQRLVAITGENRLGHALLLHGPSGWGKRVMARQFARFLLGCARPAADTVLPGDQASDADLLTHPDALIVAREPAPTTGALRTQITIDQIRRLTGFLGRTSGAGGRRIVILERVEELNGHAANALLKSLEEPGPATHLLLVCDQPSRTLATIRSRCQLRALPPGTATEARAWLQAHLPATANIDALLAVAGGAPLLALEYGDSEALTLAAGVEALLDDGNSQDLLELPGRPEPAALRARADLLLSLLYRALARRIRAGRGAPATHPEQHTLERVLRAKKMLASTANPNVTLLLEDLLLPLTRAGAGRHPQAGAH